MIEEKVNKLCENKLPDDDIECVCGKKFKMKNKMKHIKTKHHIKECYY